MSKPYIPAISPKTAERLPHAKWLGEVLPFCKKASEEISFSKKQQQIILSAVTGDASQMDSVKNLFKGLKLAKRYRAYLFSYLVLEASKNLNHYPSARDIMEAYKSIFNNVCRADYPILVSNYGGFKMMPNFESTVYVPTKEETLSKTHVQNVTDILWSVSKSNRTPVYNTQNLQTLEELDETNKALEKSGMEYVFQFANTHNVLMELMKTLQDSTPEDDLQRSVSLFANHEMMYEFFTFMRSKGIAIA